METPSFERIGPDRFALWKSVAKEPPLRFSRWFPLMVTVVIVAVLGSARFVLSLVESGVYWAGGAWGMSILGLTYLGAFVGAIRSRSKNKAAKILASKPAGVPDDALLAIVRIVSRGGSRGWLWIENDLLVFQGDRFDFRLKRDDFKPKKAIAIGLKNGLAALRGPKGLPAMVLRVILFAPDGSAKTDRKNWEAFEKSLAKWETARRGTSESLFPPLRYGTIYPGFAESFVNLLPVTLSLAIAAGACSLLFRDQTRGNALGIAFSASLLGVVLSCLGPMMRLDAKSLERRIERVKASLLK